MILTLLLFALGVPLPIIIIIWMIGVVCERPPQPQRPVVNVNVPQSPVQRWSGAVPGQPGSDSSTWAHYAMRNPEVKLQIVEKYEVADGRFTAEKHMRMTGPVPEPRVICVFPSLPKKKTWWEA